MDRRTFSKALTATFAALTVIPAQLRAQAEKAASKTNEMVQKLGLRSRNDLGGNIGTDPMWSLTTGTGARPKAAKDGESSPKIKFTKEEQDILDGKQGPAMQKGLKTIVAYGELFGATELVDLDHQPHIAMAFLDGKNMYTTGQEIMVAGGYNRKLDSLAFT